MSTSTVTSDYKVTLPKEICESMHLQPGQEFELIRNGSGIQMISKLTETPSSDSEFSDALNYRKLNSPT